MYILDIDLDFFLSDPVTRSEQGRIEDSYTDAWSEKEVRQFLESHCYLNRENPIRGKFFIEHHEIFYFWKKLIDNKYLKVPFDIVHVDAHADLGSGDSSYRYIMTDLLHQPYKERFNPKEGGFDGLKEGNFLSFAIACRWIKSIVYVHHPRIEWKNVDIGEALFKNFDKNSKIIQLKKISYEEFQRYIDRGTSNPTALEPEVPLAFVNHTEFKAQKIFTYVFFTHSPEYTPSKADFLIPIIREYINETWYLNEIN